MAFSSSETPVSLDSIISSRSLAISRKASRCLAMAFLCRSILATMPDMGFDLEGVVIFKYEARSSVQSSQLLHHSTTLAPRELSLLA